MGTSIGLLCGLGIVLIGSALLEDGPPRAPRSVRIDARRIGAASASGLLVLALASAVSRSVVIGLAFAALGTCLPTMLRRRRRRLLQSGRIQVWPDAVDDLASGVRAGMSLADALAALAERGPEELKGPFAEFAADHRVGMGFDPAMDRLKERLDDPVGDRVVEALRIARAVGGGDLGRLLRNLSTYLREEVRLRSELEARQSWAVTGARMAVAAPWLVLVLLSLSPDVAAQYDSPGGVVVILSGLAACITAYALMRRIGRLPTEVRVLQ